MKPTVGRIVHYRLSCADCHEINRRRVDHHNFWRQNAGPREDGTPKESGEFPGRSGHIGHWGNQVSEGEVYPAMIIRNWTGTTCNLQVYLDGNDVYWATSRQEGAGPGYWSWPAREEETFRPVFADEQLKALTKVL